MKARMILAAMISCAALAACNSADTPEERSDTGAFGTGAAGTGATGVDGTSSTTDGLGTTTDGMGTTTSPGTMSPGTTEPGVSDMSPGAGTMGTESTTGEPLDGTTSSPDRSATGSSDIDSTLDRPAN